MSLGGEPVRSEVSTHHDERIDTAVHTPMGTLEEDELEPDVPIGQKMLSAVSGSILTSLLGMVATGYVGSTTS